ncbi:hypothetical protein T11_15315 [Trichinella zimbabwensis]|uniref:Uncharacterized protein n=1 Tax=Trichinella zimbabwensis TaxID=268475 RepID=A0A0V1HNK1_9BILA|nr:hypothetical protein T11_15315 [Trichinella zimbabwensis]
MHYVFTQILRYSHAVLDCASLGAHILRFQTYLDQLPSLPSIQESCDRSCRKPTARSQPLVTAPNLVKSLSLHSVFRSTLLAVVMNEAIH